jgi:branched-chain amino acid transport system ATP-binding protein
LLELHQIETFYGKIPALKGVSLQVVGGSITALLGANGAGKTTTLKTITGLLHPAKGTIIFNGNRIERTSPASIVRFGISMVPEGRQVFPEMTVKENLEMGAFTRKDSKAVQKDLNQIFDNFPVLEKLRSKPAGLLSGGEQQMLVIGRALLAKPKLLLLDEPSLGLAPMIVDDIFDIIEKIKQEGTTILLVEQNARIAFSVSDYCYILETGNIDTHGQPDTLINKEDIVKSYLG